MHLTRKRATVAVLAVALVITAVAIAAWIVSATGPSGTAKTGSAPIAPTVTQPSAGGDGCLPGQSCDAAVSVSNPNSYALTLVSVTFNSTFPAGSSTGILVEKPYGTANAACPATNFTWSADKTGLSITVPPGSSSVTIPDLFAMSASAPIACADSFVHGAPGGNQFSYAFEQ